MHILLLNLTRFGDLLQSQAAIKDLVRMGHTVGLVYLENFSGAARLLDGLSYVAALPGARLLQGLARGPQDPGDPGGALQGPSGDVSRQSRRGAWRAPLADLGVWRDALARDFPLDLVCNLTPNLPTRLLARYIGGSRPCVGFALDSNGFGVNSSAWAAFFQGASTHRGVSPFNVVDLFRKVAEVEVDDEGAVATGGSGRHTVMPSGDASLRPPDAESLAWAENFLRSSFITQSDKFWEMGDGGFVGFQLGASEERRRWPVEYFAILGQRLWEEEGVCPALLGSDAERPLAEEYGRLAKHPFVSLCGETDLAQLAAVLRHMRLLVTNDTGTMHLAAGLGTPVLAVFLATAQPFDTGPYRAGSCSVEPDLPCHPCAFGSVCPHEGICRTTIQPEVLADLALSHLRTGEWQKRRFISVWRRCSGFPSGGQDRRVQPPVVKTLAPCQTKKLSVSPGAWTGARVWIAQLDDNGFMGLFSLSGHEKEERTRWLLLQRHLLRPFLDRDRAGEVFAQPCAASWGLRPETRTELLRDLSIAAAFMELLLQQGKTLLTRDVPMMRQKFLSTWQKAQVALEGNPRLAALETLWVEETQAEGQDLPCILRVVEDFLALLHSFEGEIRQ